MMIVGKVKNNASYGRNRTWFHHVMKPLSILLHHSDTAKAVWIWRGVRGCAKIEICTPPSMTTIVEREAFFLQHYMPSGQSQSSWNQKFKLLAIVKARRVKVKTQATTKESLTRKLRIKPSSSLERWVHHFFFKGLHWKKTFRENFLFLKENGWSAKQAVWVKCCIHVPRNRPWYEMRHYDNTNNVCVRTLHYHKHFPVSCSSQTLSAHFFLAEFLIILPPFPLFPPDKK